MSTGGFEALRRGFGAHENTSSHSHQHQRTVEPMAARAQQPQQNPHGQDNAQMLLKLKILEAKIDENKNVRPMARTRNSVASYSIGP